MPRKSACWNSNTNAASNYENEYSLDSDLVARFIFALLPHEPPYRLAKSLFKYGLNHIANLLFCNDLDKLTNVVNICHELSR